MLDNNQMKILSLKDLDTRHSKECRLYRLLPSCVWRTLMVDLFPTSFHNFEYEFLLMARKLLLNTFIWTLVIFVQFKEIYSYNVLISCQCLTVPSEMYYYFRVSKSCNHAITRLRKIFGNLR